jgi:hypothetical protein
MPPGRTRGLSIKSEAEPLRNKVFFGSSVKIGICNIPHYEKTVSRIPRRWNQAGPPSRFILAEHDETEVEISVDELLRSPPSQIRPIDPAEIAKIGVMFASRPAGGIGGHDQYRLWRCSGVRRVQPAWTSFLIKTI